VKVEKLAKNGEKGQNCYPLSPFLTAKVPSVRFTAENYHKYIAVLARTKKSELDLCAHPPETDPAVAKEHKLRGARPKNLIRLGFQTVRVTTIEARILQNLTPNPHAVPVNPIDGTVSS